MPTDFTQRINETQEQYNARLNALLSSQPRGDVGFNYGAPITSSSLNVTGETPFSSPSSATIPVVPQLLPTAEETRASAVGSRLEELNKQLIGQSAFASEKESELGIQEKTQTQRDLESQLNQLTTEAKAIPIQLQQDVRGRGVTAAGLAPIQAGALRENALKALTVSSLLEASRGNLASAYDLVDRAVKAKYDPIKEEIDVLTANLKLIKESPEFTRQEKNRAAIQEEIQVQRKKEVESKEKEEEAIQKVAVIAAQNGADGLTLRNIQRASSEIEAERIANEAGVAVSGQTQVVEVGGRKLLINSRTGETIKDFGSTVQLQPGENPQLYSGLNSATATAVRGKVLQFKTEPTVQNFATIQDGYRFASSISGQTTNPADDQALIYSLAKALDPGSVVREGEYATAQKYAQSWVQAYGKGVEQALLGTGFLSSQARENIKKTIKQKYNSSKTSYQNVYDQYAKGINSLTGRANGDDFLIDYSIPEEAETDFSSLSDSELLDKIPTTENAETGNIFSWFTNLFKK